MRRPFFRSDVMTWYVQIGNKQHPLGRDPRFKTPPATKPKEPPPEIQKKYLAIMQRQEEPEDRTLRFCVDEYLRSLDGCVEKTMYRARYFLGLFLAAVGDVKVSKLKKHHLTDAVKGKPWKPNTIHAFYTRVEACLNYCEREDWIPKNPFRGKVQKPTPERREEIMSAEDRQRVIDAAAEPFKSALLYLTGTGCRPIELRFARVEKCDLDKGVIMVRNKTRRKTGVQERPVFLSTAMIDLCRQVIGARKEGWLFRNKFGGQWTQTAFEHRFQKLCAKLAITKGAQLYSFRHGWGSVAINEKGMNPALVAIQMGHTDLRQLMKTYLHADTEAMRRALDK